MKCRMLQLQMSWERNVLKARTWQCLAEVKLAKIELNHLQYQNLIWIQSWEDGNGITIWILNVETNPTSVRLQYPFLIFCNKYDSETQYYRCVFRHTFDTIQINLIYFQFSIQYGMWSSRSRKISRTKMSDPRVWWFGTCHRQLLFSQV